MARQTLRRQPPRRRWTIATGLAVALAASCGGSGFRYVADRDAGVYFKLPDGWTTLPDEGVTEQFASPTADADTQRLIGFDAAPDPAVEHLLHPDAAHPAGLSRVRLLSIRERDQLSLAALRNEFLPVDSLPPGRVRLLASEDIETDTGLHGTESTFEIGLDEGTYTLTQVVLVDAGTQVVYGLVVGCTQSCYAEQRSDIEAVVESWSIEEP
ncbi:hypothetical protein [Egicoccus sp. AB-alg2]|uniref:hypothetical protein n=1 Tax=Egicoccus sp. AB-alg2 TaxID=3242693 RepID=UPI00359D4956